MPNSDIGSPPFGLIAVASDVSRHRQTPNMTRRPIDALLNKSEETGIERVAKRRRRRPSPDRWTKVTVVLMDRQVVFLDRLMGDIRAAHGARIGRAQLIRALVDALAESDVDLTNSCSEEDLVRVLATHLRRPTTP